MLCIKLLAIVAVVQDYFLGVQIRDVSFVKPANFFLTVQLSLDSAVESPQFRTEVFSNTNQVRAVCDVSAL